MMAMPMPPLTSAGSQINLRSQTGSIGTTDDALEIDATAASAGFNADADGDIVVTDVADGLSTGQITAVSGDIVLTLPDQVTKGQDLSGHRRFSDSGAAGRGDPGRGR
jgi:hypothetical protein